MKTPRISISQLMAFVFIAALGFAGFKDPNHFWSSVAYIATLGVLLFALAGAVVEKGTQKSSWVGMAVFGWGYLILESMLVSATDCESPSIVLLNALYDQLHPNGEAIYRSLDSNRYATLPSAHFRQIGFCIITLALACLGSFAVRAFAREAKAGE